VLLPGNLIPQPGAGDASAAASDLQDASVVPRQRARGDRFHQPLRHQAFGKFALRVFIAVHRPALAGVELAFKGFSIAVARTFAAGPVVVEPQAGADRQGASQDGGRLLGYHQEKLKLPYQVRRLFQQTLALTQRLTHQADLKVLEITQPSMDDARGTTGSPG